VEDVFFVTDSHNQPLSDPELCRRLQETIIEQLSDANGQSSEPSRITI
jgi:[protein-PII] uridylyltransferase